MKPESKFLSSEDFFGLGNVSLIISGVYEHTDETMQDGAKKNFFAVAFEKTTKKLILNATNRRTLAFAFGAITSDWIGKSVEIHVQTGVKNPKGGPPVTGLRLTASPK